MIDLYIKCQKCGKILTEPESQRRGYGPECWGKISGTYLDNRVIQGQMSIFDLDVLKRRDNNGRE